jgi:hypothetical protein
MSESQQVALGGEENVRRALTAADAALSINRDYPKVMKIAWPTLAGARLYLRVGPRVVLSQPL